MPVNDRRLGVCLAVMLLGACEGGGPPTTLNPTAGGGSSSSSQVSSSSGSSSSSASSSSSGAPPPGAGGDHVTYHFDAARTGLNPTERVLTPANVRAGSFGLQRLLQVDGKVDAQPLYLSQLAVGGAARNVVLAATESASVYAFDADAGTLLWRTSLIPAGETTGDGQGCDQVVPTIGVTATPVIDRQAGTNGEIFVVAMTKDAGGAYHHRLHALDLTTGTDVRPATEVAASYPTSGGGTTTFEAGQYEERAALLLLNGILYTTWTSHCDNPSYTGWVIGYSESTLAQAALLNIAPNATGGPSVWMSGNGPGVDAEGNLYVLTANGSFDTTLTGSGFPGGGDYGNSFVKMSTTAGLAVTDYFTLSDTQALTNADQDLGSGGELVLPDVTDATGAVRHLVVGAGKDGNLYLVNRDQMGHWNATSNAIWQQVTGALPGGVYSTPAWFNGTLYYSEAGGTVKAYALTRAKLSTTPTSQTPQSFSYPGGTPAVSANGTTNGIVWVHENADPGVLHAYDATNLSLELYNSNQAAGGRDQFGPGNKFIAPAVVDGRVLVGTQSAVAVFGLLN